MQNMQNKQNDVNMQIMPQMQNMLNMQNVHKNAKMHTNMPNMQGGRSCAGARVAPAEKFGLGRKF